MRMKNKVGNDKTGNYRPGFLLCRKNQELVLYHLIEKFGVKVEFNFQQLQRVAFSLQHQHSLKIKQKIKMSTSSLLFSEFET